MRTVRAKRIHPKKAHRFTIWRELECEIMAIAQALTDAVTALKTEIDALKVRVDTLTTGSATAAEQAQVASDVQAAADALKTIAPTS